MRSGGNDADGDPAATPRSGTPRVKGETGAGGPAAKAKAKVMTKATDWEKAKLVEVMGDGSGGMAW